MIKVLYIVDAMTYMGGTQNHIATMLRGHDARRFRPYLLCLQEKGGLGEELEREGYPVTAFGLKRIYGWEGGRSAIHLITFLRREKVDIAHCYLFSAQVYGIPAARLAGVPLVIAGRRIMGIYWRARKYVVARKLSNYLSHLQIATSRAVKDYLTREEGVCPEKVRVVHNGVDADRFRPPQQPREGRGGEPVTVGYVGNLGAAKQVDVLLKAARRILPACPGLRLLLVGGGLQKSHLRWEGKTEERLRSLVRELGIADRVAFAGPVMRTEEMMKRMDLFVMPSVSEGMSNAVLEAMAMGLPVLATDSGGNREVVLDGETGFLFPNRDDRRLGELMLDLLGDSEKRLRMGSASRARILDRFTARRMVTDMEAIYEKELGVRKR